MIVWIIGARNRATALDQQYLEHFPTRTNKIVFGLNQVDLVEPMKWSRRLNFPSAEVRQNIEVIVRDRAEKLAAVMATMPVVVPYSAKRGYNLERLFDAILDSCRIHGDGFFSF